MTQKRFERYLLDGGFWFDDYVEPVWGITDTVEDSPITYLEFQDKYKDLCDEVVDFLNELSENLIGCNKTADNAIETIKALDEEKQKVKKVLQKYLDKYTRRAIEGHPYGDVTEAISDIADELGVELE